MNGCTFYPNFVVIIYWYTLLYVVIWSAIQLMRGLKYGFSAEERSKGFVLVVPLSSHWV